MELTVLALQLLLSSSCHAGDSHNWVTRLPASVVTTSVEQPSIQLHLFYMAKQRSLWHQLGTQASTLSGLATLWRAIQRRITSHATDSSLTLSITHHLQVISALLHLVPRTHLKPLQLRRGSTEVPLVQEPLGQPTHSLYKVQWVRSVLSVLLQLLCLLTEC